MKKIVRKVQINGIYDIQNHISNFGVQNMNDVIKIEIEKLEVDEHVEQNNWNQDFIMRIELKGGQQIDQQKFATGMDSINAAIGILKESVKK